MNKSLLQPILPRFFVPIALLLFCVSSVCAGSIAGGRDAWPKYTLLGLLADCDLVVTGKVWRMTPVFRRTITTDVMLDVEEIIKGKPNGENRDVVFTQIGGKGIDPETGEGVHMHMSPQADFEIGERVMLFLQRKDDTTGLPYPEGGYYVPHGGMGKWPIKRGKTRMLYPVYDDPDDAKLVGVPIALAVRLAKAWMKDREAAHVLDDRIRSQVLAESPYTVKLSTCQIAKLLYDAKKILDGPAPPKPSK